MKLAPVPFGKIRSGKKTIELRLYDEKRRKIEPGDTIEFTKIDDTSEVIIAAVKAIYVFDSFAALYSKLPLLKCGYTKENIDKASPEDMNRYYTAEQQQKYGVCGIEILIL